MPGIDIAEIAGRDAERHRPPGIARQRTERQTGGNVINDLRRHPGKIDRVDGRQVQLLPQGAVPEQGFDDVLAVVEIPLDRQRMRVRRRHGRHLPALHLGNPAVRVQHDDVEGGAVAAGGERGGAGVAGRGADDRHMLMPARQHGIEQPPDQLQRQILEGERRAVEQLQQPQPLVQLNQRRHRRMAEGAVGGVGQLAQFGSGKRVARKQGHDSRRELGIGQPGQAAQRRRVEFRQGFGHKQPAILREAGEQHVLEGIGRRHGPGIAGTEVFHPVKV